MSEHIEVLFMPDHPRSIIGAWGPYGIDQLQQMEAALNGEDEADLFKDAPEGCMRAHVKPEHHEAWYEPNGDVPQLVWPACWTFEVIEFLADECAERSEG